MARQQQLINRSWFQINLLKLKKLIPAAFLALITTNALAQPAPTLDSFALSPSVVYVTESFNLSWSSTNADTCVASTDEIYASSGNVTYSPGTLPVGSHDFSMYCQGPGGVSNTLYSSITIQAAPPAPVLTTFTFSPSTIYEDDSVLASWSSSDATACEVVGEGAFPPSGSDTYPPYSFPVGTHVFQMSCSGAGGTSNTLSATLTVLQPLPMLPAVPTGLTSSNTSPVTGESYTVSWNAVSGATSYQLSENGTPSTTTATSQSLSQTNVGSYSYQISACNAAGCSSLSSAITVSVSEPPPLPPVSLIGFDAEYMGYWPINPSSNDLYIVRESTDGNYEGVTGFILAEQPGNIYSLNANPTPAQISQFDVSTPASFSYELFDVNLDGATDMVLMNTSNTAVGIVYAAPNSQSAPVAYKHIDAEFVEFFADLYEGILDPDYFYDTAYENNWGTWSYAPLEHMLFNTVMLHKSGQLFRPDANYPPQQPGVPFYTNISEAYDGSTEPFWCQLNFGLHEFINGSWWVYGWYYPAVFTPDYSSFNEDAMEVADPIANYLSTESAASIPPIVFQILEDILGTNHDLDNEPAIFNLIKRIGQLLFGFGIEQEAELPSIYAKIELVYTDATSSMGMNVPLARHAFLQVTMPNGDIYVTRGGPEDPPSYGAFGNIESEAAVNPQNSSDFKDHGKLVRFRQLVGFTTLNGLSVAANVAQFSTKINACQKEYKPTTQNSNSYAFQSVEELTSTLRPVALVLAPGWNTVLDCP